MRFKSMIASALVSVCCGNKPPDMRDGGTEFVFKPTGQAPSAALLKDLNDKMSGRLAAAKIPAVVSVGAANSVNAGSIVVGIPADVSPEQLNWIRQFWARPLKLGLCEEDEAGLFSIAERGPLPIGAELIKATTPSGATRGELRLKDRDAAVAAVRALAPLLPPKERLVLQVPAEEDIDGWRILLVHPPAFDNAAVEDASVLQGEMGPMVQAVLRKDAASAFEAFTKRLIGHRIAVILDDVVVTAPTVMSAIPGGKIQISLAPSPSAAEEARFLALILRSGTALPTSLEFVSEKAVKPSR